jgi:hypothetical protein
MNYLKNHLNNNVWNLFEKMEINKRIVCSGGYDIYLKCFFSGNEIDRLICSEFEFKNELKSYFKVLVPLVILLLSIWILNHIIFMVIKL